MASSIAQPQQEGNQATLRLPNLMTQSTIYRRHEARLAKSYALGKDDSRPAILRVMSLLPGLRIIFPPPSSSQQQPSNDSVPQNFMSSSAVPRIGDYSESTLFTTTDADSENHRHQTAAAAKHSSSSHQPVVLQAIFTTAATAGIAECLFGSSSYSSNSPFGGRSHARYSPFASIVPHGDSVSMQLQNHRHMPKPAAAVAVSGHQIALAASSTSILFGTKVLTEQQLHHVNNDVGESSSFVSSAAAGAVVGLFQQLVPAIGSSPSRQRSFPVQSLSPTTAAAATMISRHMVAATMYFTTYEQLLNNLSSSTSSADDVGTQNATKNNPTNFNILMAGATAGCVYTTALNAFQRQVVPPSSAAAVTSIVRSAPIHALIFWGYETMKEQQARY